MKPEANSSWGSISLTDEQKSNVTYEGYEVLEAVWIFAVGCYRVLVSEHERNLNDSAKASSHQSVAKNAVNLVRKLQVLRMS